MKVWLTDEKLHGECKFKAFELNISTFIVTNFPNFLKSARRSNIKHCEFITKAYQLSTKYYNNC